MRGPLGTPVDASTLRSYDDPGRLPRHHLQRTLPKRVGVDGRWVLVALVHAVGIAVGPRADAGIVVTVVAVCATTVAWWGSRSVLFAAAVAATMLLAAWQGQAAWRAAEPDRLGRWSGWALVVADPASRGRATMLTVEVDGERFDTFAYGATGRKLAAVATGEYVRLAGRRVVRTGVDARRAAIRHVVGRFEVEMVGDVRVGSPATDAANRVRRTLREVAEDAMSPDEAALFSGLVIGDDARQSPEMVQRFRAVGLSHLTAVSGQNVAFVLAAAAPLLHRLSARRRWAVSLGLIVWFMVLTRFEPSVLRAGVMAMLSATAFLAGRVASPVRLLAITVTVLTAIDPMLVWSVGFWLSVSATAGVAVLAPRLEQLLRLPPWCATALGVTLGAQVGVAVPSLLVFGRLPIVALLANPAAVPVAGFVMLVGVPSALSAALLSTGGRSFVADAVMLPSQLGTRWVDQVSRVAAAVEPPPTVSAVCWVVLALVMAGRWWRNRVARQTDVPI